MLTISGVSRALRKLLPWLYPIPFILIYQSHCICPTTSHPTHRLLPHIHSITRLKFPHSCLKTLILLLCFLNDSHESPSVVPDPKQELKTTIGWSHFLSTWVLLVYALGLESRGETRAVRHRYGFYTSDHDISTVKFPSRKVRARIRQKTSLWRSQQMKLHSVIHVLSR